MTIGILALQGDYEAHARVLERLGVEWRYVRRTEDLEGIDGLILPGGESTTSLKFLEQDGFFEALRRLPEAGKPLFGTCAGAILLAREVTGPGQSSLGVIDIGIERNAYGRQLSSAVRQGACRLKNAPMEMVFIRAPAIRRVGVGVEVLGECNGEPVCVQQGTVLVATFHPELTSDTTLHEHFVKLVAESKKSKPARVP